MMAVWPVGWKSCILSPHQHACIHLLDRGPDLFGGYRGVVWLGGGGGLAEGGCIGWAGLGGHHYAAAGGVPGAKAGGVAWPEHGYHGGAYRGSQVHGSGIVAQEEGATLYEG